MIAKPSKGACGIGIFLAKEFGKKGDYGDTIYKVKS